MAGLPLDKMSVTDKIQVMESIWEDLCTRADNVPSPSWHQEVLAEREAAIQAGEDGFEDWEVAKRSIKKEIP
jgi:adenosylmethionine-8-amino-7-oxononanoate aminotransferase